MEPFAYINRYLEDVRLRASLFSLFELVFQLPAAHMEHFFRGGDWDPTYTPHSLTHNGQIVANASLFDMPLTVNGRQVAGCGIQSVMTHPNWRKRGLMDRLMNELLGRHDTEYEVMLLFTENPALYAKYGFRTIPTYRYSKRLASKEHRSGERSAVPFRLEDSEHVASVRRLLAAREPVSRLFALNGHAPMFMFNLSEMADKMCVLDDLEAIVVCEQAEGVWKLYDVVCTFMPSLNKILERIGVNGGRIELYFPPDRFGEEGWLHTRDAETSSFLMARGLDGELEQIGIQFPPTSAF